MATLAELRAQVRDLTGTLDPIGLPDDTIDRFINECYAEVCGGRPWPWLAATVTVDVAAGSREEQLPLPPSPTGDYHRGWRKVSSASFDYGNASVELALVTAQRFASFAEDARGVPQVACFRQDAAVKIEGFPVFLPSPVLQLWPAPTAAGQLVLRGTMLLHPLAADDDEPRFDVEFHPMLAYGAAVKILTRDADDSPRGQAYSSAYSDYGQRMVREYMVNTDPSPFVLGRRRGW